MVVGTRDPGKLQEWLQEVGHQARVGSFAEAAAHGEMVVNATRGERSLDVLRMAGEANLNDKILLDVANPLDFSRGMPPGLFVKDSDSLAEQIQRAFPRLKVVKALNTVNSQLMVHPQTLGGGDHTVFLSGNDSEAKERVGTLLRSFGWEDIIDLGDITTARATEMLLPLWLRLWLKLGHAAFNFKVIR